MAFWTKTTLILKDDDFARIRPDSLCCLQWQAEGARVRGGCARVFHGDGVELQLRVGPVVSLLCQLWTQQQDEEEAGRELCRRTGGGAVLP